jgi:hypothetical protein
MPVAALRRQRRADTRLRSSGRQHHAGIVEPQPVTAHACVTQQLRRRRPAARAERGGSRKPAQGGETYDADARAPAPQQRCRRAHAAQRGARGVLVARRETRVAEGEEKALHWCESLCTLRCATRELLPRTLVAAGESAVTTTTHTSAPRGAALKLWRYSTF